MHAMIDDIEIGEDKNSVATVNECNLNCIYSEVV